MAYRCPNCDSTNIRRGKYHGNGGYNDSQIGQWDYKCMNCGHMFDEPSEDVNYDDDNE